MVMFTVHKYKPYGQQLEKYNVSSSDTIVSLNVRGVVVLQGASEYFSLDNMEPANIESEARGVSFHVAPQMGPGVPGTSSSDSSTDMFDSHQAGSEDVQGDSI